MPYLANLLNVCGKVLRCDVVAGWVHDRTVVFEICSHCKYVQPFVLPGVRCILVGVYGPRLRVAVPAVVRAAYYNVRPAYNRPIPLFQKYAAQVLAQVQTLAAAALALTTLPVPEIAVFLVPSFASFFYYLISLLRFNAQPCYLCPHRC